MITTESGDQEYPLNWKFVDNLRDMKNSELSEIRNLLQQEANVDYTEKMLKELPKSRVSPTLVLKSENKIRGIFLSMELNSTTSRVLIFAINSKYQNRSFGEKCWRLYLSKIKQNGYKKIQLEVEASNKIAIKFYTKRGLKIVGQISDYYKNGLGFLMEGEC